MRYAIILLPALVACGGGVNEEEAEQIVSDLSGINQQAWTGLSVDAAQAVDGMNNTESSVEFDVNDKGGEFSGTVTNTGGGLVSWSGEIDVDGSIEVAGSRMLWEMSVTYNDVEYAGTTYNGNTTWSVDSEYDEAEVSLTYTMKGEIDAEGEVKGSAEIDLESVWTIGQSGFSMTTTGTVGKHEIDYESSLPFDF